MPTKTGREGIGWHQGTGADDPVGARSWYILCAIRKAVGNIPTSSCKYHTSSHKYYTSGRKYYTLGRKYHTSGAYIPTSSRYWYTSS